jgi:PAS domain S-box-containing protein
LLAFLLYAELKKRALIHEALQASEAQIRRSHALLLAATEGISDAVYVKDLQGRYLLINSGACRILGRSREEILGGDDTALFPPDEALKIMSDDVRVTESDAPQTYEEWVTINGRLHAFLATKGIVRNSGGEAIGIFGIARDITEQKLVEQALRESERKYRELVENANSIILHWTHDGHITFLNEFGQRFLGYSAEEILGRHVIGTIVPITDSVGHDMAQLIEQICADPSAFE